MPRTLITAGLLVLAVLPLSGFAERTARDLPLIIGGRMPVYPVSARAARVQGVVKIKVVTDGAKVSTLDVESGPPMLARSAQEDIRSWEFAKHEPTTFVTTFDYAIESPEHCTYANGTSTLSLPLTARITAPGLKTCDPLAGSSASRPTQRPAR